MVVVVPVDGRWRSERDAPRQVNNRNKDNRLW